MKEVIIDKFVISPQYLTKNISKDIEKGISEEVYKYLY